MRDKVKVEILDLTEDSNEETKLIPEPLTPVKENDPSDSEPGESSGLQKSQSGRFIRNIDKCMDKAISEIRKGQSLVTVASQYGIPQEDLYNKLVSRSLPRETEILTTAEEKSLVKWIVKSNKNNTLIFKQQLMEKVGKLKKVMNITPIFAKSKFGRMWYEYFMKNHPEIYENDGLLMPSDRVLARSLSQDDLDKKQVPTPDAEDFDILTPDEEDALINWIITSNKNNSLIFKFELMRRVSKMYKVAKSMPGFAKSKFGRMWFERFLEKHPEIYENDELLLPSQNVLEDKSNQWPDEDDIKLAQNTFKTSTDSVKNQAALLLSYGIKDAVVVLHDFRKEENSPYRLNGKVPEMEENKNRSKSRGGKILSKLKGNIKKDHRKKSNTKKKIEVNLKQQSYIDLFDEGKWEARDTYLRKNPLDKNLKRRQPWGKEYINVYVQHSIENKTENLKSELIHLKSESPLEDLDMKGDSAFEYQDESGIESDQYSSTEDSVSYETNMKLKGRKRKSETSDGKPVCKKCTRSFCNLSKLKRHMLTIHQPRELHQVTCLQCNKKFASKYHLSVHMTNFHSTTFHECEDCGRHFKFKSSMRKHQRTVHEGLENEANIFFCDICEKGFKYKNSLEAHIIYGHLKEKKPFSCNICKKSFVKHSLMLRHKTRHSKIKPMECIHCSKTYSRKYLLREHIKDCAKFKKVKNITKLSDEESEITID